MTRPIWEAEAYVGYNWEDLQEPLLSSPWQDEIRPRIQQALLQVSEDPEGYLSVGVDFGFFRVLPEVTDLRYLHTPSSEEIQHVLGEDCLEEIAGALTHQLWTMYQLCPRRDFMAVYLRPNRNKKD